MTTAEVFVHGTRTAGCLSKKAEPRRCLCFTGRAGMRWTRWWRKRCCSSLRSSAGVRDRFPSADPLEPNCSWRFASADPLKLTAHD